MFQIDVTDFAEKVAARVIEEYEKLPKHGKPLDQEFTVLSGIVLFDKTTGYLEVVSIGTGTKCLSASKLLATGGVLNDSHAEVIARRGLLIYLYENIKKTIEGNISMLKFVNNKIEMSSDYEFHFYSSQLPCGDACIMPKFEEDHELVGQPINIKNQLETNKRKAEDIISHRENKIPKIATDIRRTGAKCLPHSEQDTREPGSNYHLLGQVRTKPGRGERTLSVSCSDKIAKWIHLGVQGSLLGMFLKEPIYLKSIVIGGGVPFNIDSLKRALLLRNPNFKIENIPTFEQASVVFPCTKSSTRWKAGPASIVWVNLTNSYSEVAANGRKWGITKKIIDDVGYALSITKYNLYKRFMELLLLYEKEAIKEIIGVDSVATIPYNEMKKRNKEYYDKWAVVKNDFFHTWTIKPDIWDFCAGSID